MAVNRSPQQEQTTRPKEERSTGGKVRTIRLQAAKRLALMKEEKDFYNILNWKRKTREVSLPGM